jgi:hypothetical protein
MANYSIEMLVAYSRKGGIFGDFIIHSMVNGDLFVVFGLDLSSTVKLDFGNTTTKAPLGDKCEGKLVLLPLPIKV